MNRVKLLEGGGGGGGVGGGVNMGQIVEEFGTHLQACLHKVL